MFIQPQVEGFDEVGEALGVVVEEVVGDGVTFGRVVPYRGFIFFKANPASVSSV